MRALQAIETRFHPPTAHRGPRYSATAAAGRIYIDQDDELEPLENHERAARALCRKFKWWNPLTPGCLRSGAYVWTLGTGGRRG